MASMPDSEAFFSERAQRRVGTTLKGKYRLDHVLGSGGMAVVFSATHRNRSRVAVKLIHTELAHDAGIRARFLKEGYVANSVEHRGAVRVIDDDISDLGEPFLVMELLEGESLDSRWETCQRRMTSREVAVRLHQLLDVLIAAHAKGIVHRDIKPENLFLTTDGLIKVLDFGIARLREASVSATKSGTLFGTPAYMAPEQALGRIKDVDAQSDLWAAGATAFTLLSGRFVHAAETAEEMMVRCATQPARSVATVAPKTPQPIIEVIDHALAFAKSDRWPSARAMQQALGRAYIEAFGESVPSAWKPEENDWEDDLKTSLMDVGELAGKTELVEKPPRPISAAFEDEMEVARAPGPLSTDPLFGTATIEGKTIVRAPVARAGSPRSTIAGVAATMAGVLPSARLRRHAAAIHPAIVVGVAAAAFMSMLLVGVVIAVVASGTGKPSSNAATSAPSALPSAVPEISTASLGAPSSAVAEPSASSISIDALPKVPTTPTFARPTAPPTGQPGPTLTPTARITPVITSPPKPTAAPTRPPKRDPLAP